MSAAEIHDPARIRRATASSPVSALIDYVQGTDRRMTRATMRKSASACRRALGLALLDGGALARADLNGRTATCLPEDVQAVFVPVAAHRLTLSGSGGNARSHRAGARPAGTSVAGALKPHRAPCAAAGCDLLALRRAPPARADPAARAPKPLPIRLDRRRIYVLPTAVRAGVRLDAAGDERWAR